MNKKISKIKSKTSATSKVGATQGVSSAKGASKVGGVQKTEATSKSSDASKISSKNKEQIVQVVKEEADKMFANHPRKKEISRAVEMVIELAAEEEEADGKKS